MENARKDNADNFTSLEDNGNSLFYKMVDENKDKESIK